MLDALLRIFCGTMLIGTAACSIKSTPVVQSSNGSSAAKNDAGDDLDAATTDNGRVSTRKTDAQIERDTDAGDDNKNKSQRDAGNDAGNAADGKSGSGTKPNDKGDDKQPDAGQGKKDDQNEPADAGMKMTTPANGGTQTGDASTPDAGHPIDNLGDPASLPAKAGETIDKFLMKLGQGNAPASSITGFLTDINTEVDCKMHPFATECLTACQAVGTTCALCILNEECRTTLLDVCGVTALAGCARR